jgi:hypothetical protein
VLWGGVTADELFAVLYRWWYPVLWLSRHYYVFLSFFLPAKVLDASEEVKSTTIVTVVFVSFT